MSERGKAGGRPPEVLEPGELGSLESPGDVADAAATLAEASSTGRISEGRAEATRKILKLLLRALREEAGAEQLAEIDEKLEQLRSRQGREPAKPWERE